MVFFTSRGLIEGGTSIGDIDVETEILLNENGTPVNYIIVNQGKPGDIYDDSCNGTWCLRKDIAENRVWDSGNSNVLETSDIQAYLNGDWMTRYDPDVAEAIKQVKIPYRHDGGYGGEDRNGASGLSCKIFLLSSREIGFTINNSSSTPDDGIKLDYFISGNSSSAAQIRVATLNGNADEWSTRSPRTNDADSVSCVDKNGYYTYKACSASCGLRPCIILPFDFKLTSEQIVS